MRFGIIGAGRDKVIEILSAAAGRYSHEDIVNLNKELYNS